MPIPVMESISTKLRTKYTLFCAANASYKWSLAERAKYFLSRETGRTVSKVRYASLFNQTLMVMRCVFCSPNESEIFRTIVGLNTVYVMNHLLAGVNRSSKFLRHHIDMLPNIAALIGIGMFWSPYECIPIISGYVSASFPPWIFRAFPRSFWSSHISSITHRME